MTLRGEWVATGVVLALFLLPLTITGCTTEPMPTVVSRVEASVPDMAPPQARKYRAPIIREARLIWGLDAPVPALAAQLQQESDFRPEAQSRFAAGIAQFTSATAKDIAQRYPELQPVDVFNADWGIRAQNRYMRLLHDGLRDYPGGALTACHRYALTLSAYNGGPGWIQRDRDLAAKTGRDPNAWWGQTEMLSPRADWAFAENRGYVKRIVRVLQSAYRTWPGRYVCGELA